MVARRAAIEGEETVERKRQGWTGTMRRWFDPNPNQNRSASSTHTKEGVEGEAEVTEIQIGVGRRCGEDAGTRLAQTGAKKFWRTRSTKSSLGVVPRRQAASSRDRSAGKGPMEWKPG